MIVYLTSVNRVLVNFSGRTIWIADARRDDGSVRLHSDEKLSAFMELESAIHGSRERSADIFLCAEIELQIGNSC